MLGDYIAKHVDSIKKDTGQIGDDRLLVMTALMIADELMEARCELKELRKKPGKGKASRPAKAVDTKVAEDIQKAADRAEALKERLSDSKPESSPSDNKNDED